MAPLGAADCLCAVSRLHTEPSPDRVSAAAKTNLHHTSLYPALDTVRVGCYSCQPNVVGVLVGAGKLMIWQFETLCLFFLREKKQHLAAGKILKVTLEFGVLH